jgi:hypothetical protein
MNIFLNFGFYFSQTILFIIRIITGVLTIIINLLFLVKNIGFKIKNRLRHNYKKKTFIIYSVRQVNLQHLAKPFWII